MNNREFIKQEFALMKETPEDYDLILPFEKEILRLSGVMSKQGHSGTSASIAIPALCNTIRKLLLFKPVVPINLKKEDEWYEYESGKFQHKRCSELFRDGKSIIYNGGIVKRETVVNGEIREQPICWSGDAYLTSQPRKLRMIAVIPEGTEFFMPKTFYVDCASFEIDKETGAFKPNSGWWTSFLTDESQLEPIKKVYEITTVPLTDEEIISSAHLYNYLK